nr:uncharacterized protein LOC119171555 [Rhipicephalus microplus]
MSLSGRLALVTGGASAIGEPVSHFLDAEGAILSMAYRRLEASCQVDECLTEFRRTSAPPREIAEAIKILCSPTDRSFVTGAALEVSGGLVM